jgi:adenylylsulfate kinase-like enzyme
VSGATPSATTGVARAGELSGFNGVDAPYETLGTADLELRHGRGSTAVFAARLFRSLDAAFEEYEERLDQP